MESHLLQMRGLKPVGGIVDIFAKMSHLLQMRGLKPLSVSYQETLLCRIFYRCVD